MFSVGNKTTADCKALSQHPLWLLTRNGIIGSFFFKEHFFSFSFFSPAFLIISFPCSQAFHGSHLLNKNSLSSSSSLNGPRPLWEAHSSDLRWSWGKRAHKLGTLYSHYLILTVTHFTRDRGCGGSLGSGRESSIPRRCGVRT